MSIYLYDGTWEGFLTLIYKLTFEVSENLSKIKVYNERLLRGRGKLLLGERIEASESLVKRLKENILKIGGRKLLREVYYWYLCDRAGLEGATAKCLRVAEGDPEIFQRPHVIEALYLQRAKKALFRERHRWLGFLRFFVPEDGVLFASFEPENNLLPLIGRHFTKRFPKEKIFIVDTLRGILFLGKAHTTAFIYLEDWEISLKAIRDPFVELWKSYFNQIAVPERVNLKRQQSRVPLKVRFFLPEFMDGTS